MDVRRLRHFVRIVDCGSISKAAVEVGVAQSALSQQLAILESELGVRLVERLTTGIAPTPAGRILCSRARLILREIDTLTQEVRSSASRLAGSVLIGAPPSVVEPLAPPVIERVRQAAPGICLRWIESGGNRNDLLVDGRVEIAIPAQQPDGEGIVGEEVIREAISLISPIGMDLPDPLTAEHLASLDWVLSLPGRSVRTRLESLLIQIGRTPRIAVEIDSLISTVQLVERGFGVALMPDLAARSATRRGLVRATPLPQLGGRRLYLAHRRSPELSPSAKFVFDCLREQLPALLGEGTAAS